jgi:rod shape-determining protein MreC
VLRNERESRRIRIMMVAVCVVVGIALGVWHNRAAARGRGDFVTSAVRTVTVPLVGALTGIGRWSGRQIGWLFRGRTVDEENRRLREENARLRGENARLREADINAQRLRRQLGFPESPPARKLAADVISLRPNPNFETMIIARGSRDGVRPQSVVVSPDGLVGRVYDVAPTSAAVLLLTDSNSAVGARVQRAESRATGICKVNDQGQLALSFLEHNADVRPGDTIVSSGLGGDKGVFPKGLVIGTVASVTNDASGTSRRVLLRPAVNFDRLEEVYVIP